MTVQQEIILRNENKKNLVSEVYSEIEGMVDDKGKILAKKIIQASIIKMSEIEDINKIDDKSKIKCIVSAVQYGLLPGNFNQIHFVPFKDKKMNYQKRLAPIIGYQGLITLIVRYNPRISFDVQLAYEKDTFKRIYGSAPRIDHFPFEGGERGAVSFYYATAFTGFGNPPATKCYSAWEMGEWVKKNDHKLGPLWRNKETKAKAPTYDSMALKTCVRHLSKVLPIGDEASSAIENLEKEEALITEAPREAVSEKKEDSPPNNPTNNNEPVNPIFSNDGV